MDNEHRCPRCGRPLGANAPQRFCPECLMEAGFATGAVPDANQPTARLPFTPPSLTELASIFPQLEILELLGQGGMGAVYKARQKHLDRVVALKILPPGIGADPAFAERFTREAKALARLNHPGVVTLYESGRADGLYFFLMEFVDGVSLRYLLQGQRLTPREALAIVPQICDALQYAHDQGIVHRDIKPENILLDRQGRVKVADFGLAKLVGNVAQTSSSASSGSVLAANSEEAEGGPSANSQAGQPALPALTEPDKVMGTPNYMAPEQREHPTEVDHRADIYSLGVVFYEMLTGELPQGLFKPPSKKAPVDVRLDEVVLGALAKEPEERYQQASIMKSEVETIASMPAPAEATYAYEQAVDEPASFGEAAEPTEMEPSVKHVQRIAFIAGLVTAILLLGLVGIIWALRGKPESRPVATKSRLSFETKSPSLQDKSQPFQTKSLVTIRTPPIPAPDIPPRDPLASSNLIDLTAYYNCDLNHNWHDPRMESGNDLRELPTGLQMMDGTMFDVRGLVAVNQESEKLMSGRMNLPPQVQGILIGQICKRLHFLHSAYNAAFSNGELIGRYVVRFADGQEQIIPIVTGQDVLDWHNVVPPGSPLVVAWLGDNPRTRAKASEDKKIRVYKSTWENPNPDVKVMTIDLVGVRRGPSPLLIAITAESSDAPPPNAEASVSRGFRLLFHQKDAAAAMASFEASVRDFPESGEAYHGLALAQREAGDPASALTNHNRAIELSPDRADYYFARGMTYQRLKNYDAAIKDFELGLQQKPIECLAAGLLDIGLAQAYRAKGELQKALAHNDQAIALNPGNNGYYQERGITYEALGDHERAAADFSRRNEVMKLKKPR